MPLISNSYGKGRVRVMRVHRDNERNEVRELTVSAMLEGGFAKAYTAGDNAAVVATDTIKNIAYIVARENMTACAEDYAQKLAARFLDRYPQVDCATVSTAETKWVRATLGGTGHPHSFVLDSNGTPTASVTMGRDGATTIVSGIAAFTFMKSTASGWAGYVMDDYTTLPETQDRIAATAMDATWTWLSAPADYHSANTRILDVMLDVFATTYSRGGAGQPVSHGRSGAGRGAGTGLGQHGVPEQALHPGQPRPVRPIGRQHGLHCDRRAAWPNRMHRGAGPIARPRPRRLGLISTTLRFDPFGRPHDTIGWPSYRRYPLPCVGRTGEYGPGCGVRPQGRDAAWLRCERPSTGPGAGGTGRGENRVRHGHRLPDRIHRCAAE